MIFSAFTAQSAGLPVRASQLPPFFSLTASLPACQSGFICPTQIPASSRQATTSVPVTQDFTDPAPGRIALPAPEAADSDPGAVDVVITVHLNFSAPD